MKPTHAIAVLFVVAGLIPAFWTPQSSEDKRTPPPGSAPAPSQQTRGPVQSTPPAKAAPRPPASRPPGRPAARPPARQLDDRTLTYPYDFDDFDLVYRFPSGVYPHSAYGYPPYPYPGPAPGRMTAEGETQGMGALRFDIPQKEASVFIDSFYVGAVDDFNGSTEQLTLPPGPHRLELRAAGYETLIVDVNIQAGKTITYRTPMQPAS